MQYGLIGSMLLKRGAHDEAAQVFQKALELSPDDVETQKNLVRSLLAQKNADGGDGGPQGGAAHGREPRSLGRGPARDGASAPKRSGPPSRRSRSTPTPKTPRALPLPAARPGAGARSRRSPLIGPAVDAAIGRRDFARAAEYSRADPRGRPGPRRGASRSSRSVHEAEGNRAGPREGPRRARRGRREARRIRRRPSTTTAARRRPIPSNVEAAAQLQDIGTPTEVPAPASGPGRRGVRQPEYQELDPRPRGLRLGPCARSRRCLRSTSIRSRLRRPRRSPRRAQPRRRRRPRRPSAEGALVDEQQIETLIVEAEVFAKYGLVDKAIERLFSLVRRRPDLLRARERLVELLAESKQPGAAARGRRARRGATGRPATPDDAQPRPRDARDWRPPRRREPPASHAPPPAAAAEVEFEEFDIGHPVSPPAQRASRARFPTTRSTSREPETASRRPRSRRLATPEPDARADTEFVSYEQLGNLLEDEMQRAGDSAGGRSRPRSRSSTRQNLFADEQKFFNLAEELEKELGDEAVPEEPGGDLDAAGRGLARGDLPRVQEGRRAAALGRGLRDALQPRHRLQGDGPRRRGDRRVPAREQGPRPDRRVLQHARATASSRRGCRSSRSSGSARGSRRPRSRTPRRPGCSTTSAARLPGHRGHGHRPTRRSRRSTA